MLSGAAAGLSADLMAGGLSFGAGALVGGILGALGFAGAEAKLARAIKLTRLTFATYSKSTNSGVSP